MCTLQSMHAPVGAVQGLMCAQSWLLHAMQMICQMLQCSALMSASCSALMSAGEWAVAGLLALLVPCCLQYTPPYQRCEMQKARTVQPPQSTIRIFSIVVDCCKCDNNTAIDVSQSCACNTLDVCRSISRWRPSFNHQSQKITIILTFQ